MNLVRARAGAALVSAALAGGCNAPGGTGSVVFSDLYVGDCTFSANPLSDPESFSLDLNLLVAERFGNGLLIRLQDGTAAAGGADGVYVSIGDVRAVSAGTPLDIGQDQNVMGVLYLLRTCPAGRPAVGLTGTITFSAFEDANGNGGPDFRDRIAGTMAASGLDESDPAAPMRASLDVTFDFVMRRGHPSQRFPTIDAIASY